MCVAQGCVTSRGLLRSIMCMCVSLQLKVSHSLGHAPVQMGLGRFRTAALVLREAEQLQPQHACMILCLPAIGQEHVLSTLPTGRPCS